MIWIRLIVLCLVLFAPSAESATSVRCDVDFQIDSIGDSKFSKDGRTQKTQLQGVVLEVTAYGDRPGHCRFQPEERIELVLTAKPQSARDLRTGQTVRLRYTYSDSLTPDDELITSEVWRIAPADGD